MTEPLTEQQPTEPDFDSGETDEIPLDDQAPLLVDDSAQAGQDADATGIARAFSEAAALPGDPNSAEFVRAVRALRQHFESRQDFNAMVCDQLAMRGVPPNGSNVLEISSWGTKSAVIADVRAWYAGLAHRLNDQYAQIPEASRRQANALLESLWALATKAAVGPIYDLQQQLVGALARADALQAQYAQTEKDRAKEKGLYEQELALLRRSIAEASEATRIKLQAAAQAEQEKLARIDDLTRSIAQANLEFRDQRLALEVQHRDQIQQLQSQFTTERNDLILQMQSVSKELSATRALMDRRLEEKDAQARSDATAHLLAIDRARQDARELAVIVKQLELSNVQLQQDLKAATVALDDCLIAKARAEQKAGTGVQTDRK